MKYSAIYVAGRVWWWWSSFWGAIVLALFIVAAALSVVRPSRTMSSRDHEFLEWQLKPLARYVESFRETNGRLPTKREFLDWADRIFPDKAVWYYPRKPRFMKDWGSSGRAFVVGGWRGEWVQYYRSWDEQTFTGDGNSESEEDIELSLDEENATGGGNSEPGQTAPSTR